MLLDKARNRLPDRLQHFTDRQAQIMAFDALWAGDEWILAFHGMSGNGKTTLIDFLVETRCRPQNIPYIWLDFGNDLGASLRTDFRALTDELAYSSSLQLPKRAIRAYETRRDQAWQHLQARKVRFQTQASISAEGGSQIADSPLAVHQDIGQAIRQLEREARAEIGAALVDALAQPANRPAVIFLDTFELMAEGADQDHTAWLWDLLSKATNRRARLRVVVGSRRPLDVQVRHGHQLLLDTFSLEDSDSLLRHLEVDDADWRSAVYNRLAGGHPLLTEMAADLWHAARSANAPLPASAIPDLAGHERAVDWLAGRILDRLDEPLKSAVRWASLLRRFNRDSLVACLDPSLPPITEEDYDRLRRYSFVERARSGLCLS